MDQEHFIPVDFGNTDEDRAVRLVTQDTIKYLFSNGIELAEGLQILMSDGELIAEGTCTRSQGMWVAVVKRWIKS